MTIAGSKSTAEIAAENMATRAPYSPGSVSLQAQRDNAHATARAAEQRVAELEHFVRQVANSKAHSDESRSEEFSEFRRQARKLMEQKS